MKLMKLHHCSQFFREKRLLNQFGGPGGWPSITVFGDATKAAFTGIGKTFEALGSVLEGIGTGVNWLVKQGPLALYRLFLGGKYAAMDVGRKGKEFFLDEVIELNEYFDPSFGHPLPLPDRNDLDASGKLKYFGSGANGDVIFDEEKFQIDIREVWKKRIFRLKELIAKESRRNRPNVMEGTFLNRELQIINRNQQLAPHLISQFKTQLIEVENKIKRLEVVDEDDDDLDDLYAQKADLEEKISNLEPGIDKANHEFVVFDETTGLPKVGKDGQWVKKAINLDQRRTALDIAGVEPSVNIAFWRSQIKSIIHYKDPYLTRSTEETRREGELRDLNARIGIMPEPPSLVRRAIDNLLPGSN